MLYINILIVLKSKTGFLSELCMWLLWVAHILFPFEQMSALNHDDLAFSDISSTSCPKSISNVEWYMFVPSINRDFVSSFILQCLNLSVFSLTCIPSSWHCFRLWIKNPHPSKPISYCPERSASSNLGSTFDKCCIPAGCSNKLFLVDLTLEWPAPWLLSVREFRDKWVSAAPPGR